MPNTANYSRTPHTATLTVLGSLPCAMTKQNEKVCKKYMLLLILVTFLGFSFERLYVKPR